ncbi:MAG: hypothetical protein A3J24_03310 [Deltaproteobacteria bacterium RIFCSPLOWO2_02_FULL_53_8]|nr:MAG: hypothetical protein A3J24_03310 [Deltaproteobacteria bacterium RIFCSPLOWO2_02_FULL_53_8]
MVGNVLSTSDRRAATPSLDLTLNEKKLPLVLSHIEHGLAIFFWSVAAQWPVTGNTQALMGKHASRSRQAVADNGCATAVMSKAAQKSVDFNWIEAGRSR